MIHVEFKDGTTVKAGRGISLLEAIKRSNITAPLKPLAAKVDNKVYDLHKKLNSSCVVELLDLRRRDGHLVYQRSLTFLLVKAVHDIFPDLMVSVNHSLSKGLYCTIYRGKIGDGRGPLILKNADIERIKLRMREIVEEDIPFIRVDMLRKDAIRFFRRHGQPGKAELLEYQNSKKVSVYQCGKLSDHFYGILAPSTGYLELFDLTPYPPGMILRFPTIENPTALPEFEEQKMMFQVYQEYEEWGRLLGIKNAADLNKRIAEGTIREIILTAEALHEKRISKIADMINERKQVRVLLISGPSSSGKTTFSHRLAIQLNVVGRRSFTLHLDDYFVDRERTPKNEAGEYDFESLYAIDIKKFKRHLKRFLAGESVQMPRYNFHKGKSEKGSRVKISHDTLIIVEGIHALNQKITSHIPEAMKFKVYVSSLAQLNLDEHNRVSTSDIRVLRRLIRDHQYRGYSAVETIARWGLVRRGEEQHIFPYQESADVMFNSSLIYEMAVLRIFSEPWLKKVAGTEDVYSEARRLLKFTSYFMSILQNYVPSTSILREFIGKSCFEELRSKEEGK